MREKRIMSNIGFFDRILKLCGFLFFCLIILFVFSTNVYAKDFAGGDGTKSNPYQIENINQLQNVNLDLDACYLLLNDIDASDTTNWNDGEGFNPIGMKVVDNYVPGFTGSLEGQGYKVNHLFINNSSSSSLGLFGRIGSEGLVRNIFLLIYK